MSRFGKKEEDQLRKIERHIENLECEIGMRNAIIYNLLNLLGGSAEISEQEMKIVDKKVHVQQNQETKAIRIFIQVEEVDNNA